MPSSVAREMIIFSAIGNMGKVYAPWRCGYINTSAIGECERIRRRK
jgi:hypothetical protein